jgi:AcrR family transcriptional regulator
MTVHSFAGEAMSTKQKALEPVPPDDSRRVKEMRARRLAILDAAEGIFAKKGYHDASMAEIARAAEFGVGYLYRHFEDKGDLYLAVVERKIDSLLGALRASLVGGPVRERLTIMTRIYFAFFEANRAFFKLLIEQGLDCPYELRQSHRARVIPKMMATRNEILEVVRQGIAQRELRDADPNHLTTALFGVLQGFVSTWVFTDPSAPLSAMADVATVLFFEGAGARV